MLYSEQALDTIKRSLGVCQWCLHFSGDLTCSLAYTSCLKRTKKPASVLRFKTEEGMMKEFADEELKEQKEEEHVATWTSSFRALGVPL